MSQEAIRNALETALAAVDPTFPTAWANQSFAPPVSGAAYQEPFVLFGEPVNAEMGDRQHREEGIFQINLQYPPNTGDGAARTKAGAIKAAFYRTRSLVSGGITTVIERTPHAGGGRLEEGRWMVPVKIRFYAYI